MLLLRVQVLASVDVLKSDNVMALDRLACLPGYLVVLVEPFLTLFDHP